MVNKKSVNLFRPFLIVGVFLIPVLALFNSMDLFPRTVLQDSDLDGYISIDLGGDDCDDSNSLIHPSASDVPDDGIDQDCRGGDATLQGVDLLVDSDSDSYILKEDCDDTDSTIHPEAPEIFNFVDDDCNGVVDDGYKNLVLFEDFVIPSYEPSVIYSTSRNIVSTGNLKDVYLYIESSVDSPGRPLTQYDSVYIFVDDIHKDGHLARAGSLIDSQPDSLGLTKWLFNMSSVPLTQLPIDVYTEGSPMDLTSILNEPGTHKLGAFVATERYGVLVKLALGYKTGDIYLTD